MKDKTDQAVKQAFLKMHGLGNDFAIFDARQSSFSISAESARRIANRRTGIGCDQIITLLPSTKADLFMRIQNANGTEAQACGNASRCVARLLTEEGVGPDITIDTLGGIVRARHESGLFAVDLGQPRFHWQDIPLREERDTENLKMSFGPLKDAIALSVGNPHIVFFVENAESIDLQSLGPEIERYVLFPEGINVSVASFNEDQSINLRVWERGTGLTLACGTAAAATLVAAVRTNKSRPESNIHLPGGTLNVRWRDDNHVEICGPAELSYQGFVNLEDTDIKHKESAAE